MMRGSFPRTDWKADHRGRKSLVAIASTCGLARCQNHDAGVAGAFLFEMSLKRAILGIQASHTAMVTLGNGFGAGLGLVVLIVLSRALGADGYGRIAPALTIIDLGQLLVDTLLAAGVVTVASRAMASESNPACENSGMDAIRTGLLLRAGAGLLYASAFLLFAEWLAPALFREAPFAATIVRLAGIGGGLMAFQSALIGIAQIRQEFGRVALAASYKNLFRLIAIAFFLLANQTGTAVLALGLTISGIAALVATAVTVGRAGYIAPRYDRDAARAMLSINKWMALASISIVSSRIDIMLLSAFSTSKQVAFYAASMQLCIAIGIVSQAIVTTQLPRISRYEDPGEMRDYLRKWLHRMPSAFLIIFVVPFISPWLLPTLMGESFVGGSRVFDLLFASSMISLLMNPVLIVLFPLGSARYFGLTALFQVLAKWAITLFVISDHGAIGLGWADIVTKVAASLVILSVLSRKLNGSRVPRGRNR